MRDAAVKICGEMPPQLGTGTSHCGLRAQWCRCVRRDFVRRPPGDSHSGGGQRPSAAVALIRGHVGEHWGRGGGDGVERHDRVLAATSHLPHVLAYALVDALSLPTDSDEIFRCAAGGFRDFTRIASSDPTMWRDIALANRSALLAGYRPVQSTSGALACCRREGRRGRAVCHLHSSQEGSRCFRHCSWQSEPSRSEALCISRYSPGYYQGRSPRPGG